MEINPVVGKYLRFMPIALTFAMMSKDTSTKVGALALGPDYEVRSTGWNGAPRGSKADEDSRFDRPEKYAWSVHAEMNVVAQAARFGASLAGCTIVVTHAPCMICARLVVQAGFIRVVCRAPDGEFADRWAEDLKRTRILFEECGVEFITM